MSELRQKLQDDILTNAPWDALREHLQNLLLVDGLSLVDVGEALAEDDVERVEKWLEEGTLSRPSTEQIAFWEEEEPAFVSLIVQPWILVLVQSVELEEE